MAAIAIDLAVRYGVPIGQMRKQVRLAVRHLESLGLMEAISIVEPSQRAGARRRRERP